MLVNVGWGLLVVLDIRPVMSDVGCRMSRAKDFMMMMVENMDLF